MDRLDEIAAIRERWTDFGTDDPLLKEATQDVDKLLKVMAELEAELARLKPLALEEEMRQMLTQANALEWEQLKEEQRKADQDAELKTVKTTLAEDVDKLLKVINELGGEVARLKEELDLRKPKLITEACPICFAAADNPTACMRNDCPRAS